MNSLTEHAIPAGRLALAATALGAGLAIDVRVELPGQVAIGAAVWALLLWLIAPLPPAARRLYLLCAAIATAGELFLSLGWGLYAYRLENVPHFVPPGHALMLMLGLALARRMPEPVAAGIGAAALAYGIAAPLAGLDTLALPLALLLALAALALPAHRRLLASTFVLCLGLELYGTTLGNWAWAREVPWVGLVTTNPPALAGAFYCALDALVIAAVVASAASGGACPARAAHSPQPLRG